MKPVPEGNVLPQNQRPGQAVRGSFARLDPGPSSSPGALSRVGAQLPKGDDSQHHEIGKEQRSHGRSPVNEVFEGVNRRPAQVTLGVQHESPQPPQALWSRKNRSPDPLGPGLQIARSPLLWCEALVIAQADRVLEHGRARRQVGWVEELRVEEVVTLVRRTVHGVAALKYAGVVLRVVHADH